MLRAKWIPLAIFGLAAFLAILCAAFGVLLVVRDVAGTTEITILGWKISTTAGGLAALFIGCGAAVGVVRLYPKLAGRGPDPYLLYLSVAVGEMGGLILELKQLAHALRTDADLAHYHERRLDEWVMALAAVNRFAGALWLGHAASVYGKQLGKIKSEAQAAKDSLNEKLGNLRGHVRRLSEAHAHEAEFTLAFGEAIRQLEVVADAMKKAYESGKTELDKN